MKKEVKQLDRIVHHAHANSSSEMQMAIALHDFVRDQIKFGFTPYFDEASSAQTLKLGVGHCNPQARLMVDLFRHGGFESRFRPATISNDILRGAAITPKLLSHVFTEVKLDDKWIRLDSYIVDSRLRVGAITRLKKSSRQCGFGCHVTATGIWDGQHDAFSQIASNDMILELHEPVDEIEEFYNSRNYRHRHGLLTYNLLFSPGRLAPRLATKVLNKKVEGMRVTGNV